MKIRQSVTKTASNRLFDRFNLQLAVDLGTCNTRIYVAHKGVILNEPTVIARQTRGGKVVAVGKQAESMLGRAPQHITVSRPIARGVISDFDMAQQLLSHFVDQVYKHPHIFPIRLFSKMIIGIPAGVTEVERKAVVDAGISVGMRRVYLIEESMASAIGANLPIEDARASMVVNVGGGVTEIAVLSWKGVVVSRLIDTAGDEIDAAISDWVRDKYNLLIGRHSAEDVKQQVQLYKNADNDDVRLSVRGRDLSRGLPREQVLTHDEVIQAIQKPLDRIVENTRDVIESTPPELVADLLSSGISLTGGMAGLKGIDQYLAQRLQVQVKIADNPQLAVIKGLGYVAENPSLLERLQVAWGR